MRRNEPVSQREFEIPDGATLMSTTDAQSHITYANDAFVAASGFSREQLQGQPHNMVRHPDMPPEAFADMWATLKAGEPWTALVKNRRQDGDHYWVRANATPLQRQGQISGYMSVRTKPSREEVAAAEALYRDMREGRARGRRLHKGLVVRGRALAQTMPARWRIRCAFGALALLLPAGAALLGVGGGVLGGLALWSLAVSVLGAWWLEGQIARPLERVRDHALRVVRGDKQAELDLGRVDEIGMVLRCVGQLGLMFRWIIDDVSGQAVNVRTASQEIAAGNADLSSRTEQAAASVEQTAATMDQMTATVRQNAEAAAEASRFAAATSASAGEGGRVMGEVVATMDEISGSSRRIAEIIGTIDGIAFQTNILALNAAVEAARAGEQGRGFAVVAGEVRSLAQRSAAAAREIKGLIGASADKVETGARLVGDAGRTMNEIVSQVGRVSGLIAEFSHATTEQSSGIAQVGQAVSHMDRITQQNAALVEQSAASSESLRQQATRLAEAVGVFR